MPRTDGALAVIEEGLRQMTICNACRYCEGFCAVFPAMERRRTFAPEDLHYLANLCHNCGECYHACQYTPPHEFAVNVPKAMAEIRVASYREFSPSGRFGMPAWPVFAACLAAMGAVEWATGASGGGFYGAIPHGAMVAIFGAAGALALVTLAAGVRRFWRECGGGGGGFARALGAALRDGARLRYLDNGGGRRRFHHLTAGGCALCFAATTVAAFYHYGLGLEAPYPFLSLPVALGTLGGLGLLIGPAGQYWLMRRRDAALTAAEQRGLDAGLLGLLFGSSLTGLLLLAFRGTAAMRPLLAIHLAAVLALFLSAAYGKFVHGFYRVAALVRHELESAAARKDQA